MQGSKALQEIIISSTTRKGVVEELIQMMNLMVVGASTSQDDVKYMRKLGEN